MREILVVSGKGGTGKTSFVAALAQLAGRRVVLGDCDVDAANLSLLVQGTDVAADPFRAGYCARVNEPSCTGCSACLGVCRFGAIRMTADQSAMVDDLACEGCRACSLVCPEDAIEYSEKSVGKVYLRETKFGPLIHASLGIAQDNSGKLVARVREQSREQAEKRGIDTILLDGPPGIGCPVHAALTGVNLVVAVTEPTPSGAHDLKRLLDLCAHFELKAVVVINKFDLNRRSINKIEQILQDRCIELVGAVPFHVGVPRALAQGENPLVVPLVRESLERIWPRIDSL